MIRLHHSPVPSTVLWAWERKEDLRFIDPEKVGVAFLAKTVTIENDSAFVTPRAQPLQVPYHTYLIAVTRIETRGHPMLSAAQRDIVVKCVAQSSHLPDVQAVQIDFDATLSQRIFYRALLSELRPKLAPNVQLSITALASWCLFDNWMKGVDVDDAVPMLFEMGNDRTFVTNYLSHGNDFRNSLCRESLGIGTHEILPRYPAHRRCYFFSPTHWTPELLKKIEGDLIR